MLRKSQLRKLLGEQDKILVDRSKIFGDEGEEEGNFEALGTEMQKEEDITGRECMATPGRGTLYIQDKRKLGKDKR